jgi:hypothetical protein
MWVLVHPGNILNTAGEALRLFSLLNCVTNAIYYIHTIITEISTIVLANNN